MRRNIKLIAAFNFFSELSLFTPILIIYFQRVTGSYLAAMSIFSVTMIASALFEVPTGIYSDIIGRKRTIIYGAISSIISVVFYAIGLNYWFLVAGAIFEGLARSWYSGNNEALLHDTLTDLNETDKFDHYLGKTMASEHAATSIGALVGGIVAAWSFPVALWASVIPKFIAFACSVWLQEPQKHSHESSNVFEHIKDSLQYIWRNKRLRLLTLSGIMGQSIGEATYQFRSAFIQTIWPIWAIGFASVLSNLGASLSYYFSGKIIKRYSDIKILLFSDIYSRIYNIIAALFPTIFSPILMSSNSLFFGVSQVAKSKLMHAEFTDKQRATMGSLTSLGNSLGFGIVALIIGILADKIGPATTLLISHIVLFPRIWIFWHLFKKDKK